MTMRDHEVLELLADEPELLAVADAFAATQAARRPSRTRWLLPRLGLAAALAAAVAVVLLLLPDGNHGVVDRALAAIGDGRVLHLVADAPTGELDVDLRTGRRTEPHYRVELWADQRLDRIHAVMRYRGYVAADFLWPDDAANGATVGPVDPAFAALWSGYREALDNGTAVLAGDGEAFGHHVHWLRFPSTGRSPGSEVAVDAQTYKPVVFRTYSGVQPVDEHILVAETTAFNPAEFTRQGPNPLLGTGSTSSGGGSSSFSGGGPPSTSVPHGWVTAGSTAAGEPLAAVVPTTVTSGDRTMQGYQLVYGPLDHGFAAEGATTIDELPQSGEPGSWSRLPAGSVRITSGESSGPDGDHQVWEGYLVVHGRYVTINTRAGEQAVVDIAKSLHPAP